MILIFDQKTHLTNDIIHILNEGDENFHLLLEENKKAILKTFTMTSKKLCYYNVIYFEHSISFFKIDLLVNQINSCNQMPVFIKKIGETPKRTY